MTNYCNEEQVCQLPTIAAKDEQISVLREALLSTSREDVIVPCWCVVSRDIPNHGHSERCKKATLALSTATPATPPPGRDAEQRNLERSALAFVLEIAAISGDKLRPYLVVSEAKKFKDALDAAQAAPEERS